MDTRLFETKAVVIEDNFSTTLFPSPNVVEKLYNVKVLLEQRCVRYDTYNQWDTNSLAQPQLQLIGRGGGD